MAVGLYIHVPFCHTRCHFCAFYVRIYREDWAQAYLSSLRREVQLHAEKGTLAGRRLETVYFGGGTPTTLTPAQLIEALGWIRTVFDVAPHAEVSIEAQPDTVTAAGLSQLAQSGFTRISFGLQSTNRPELIRLGRQTAEPSGPTLVSTARSAGFRSVNLDLIYGVPGQSREQWMMTMDNILASSPDHVSCYALTIEEQSHLHLDLKRGNFPPLNLDHQNELEDMAASKLAEAGFQRYEISNYAQPGHTCRHNLMYWQGEDYLGLGPSAQSYVSGVRFGNLADLDEYHRWLNGGGLLIEESALLTPEERRRESLIFGLRLTHGVPSELVQAGGEESDWMARIEQLLNDGLLTEESGRMRLTPEGRRFADSVAIALL